MAEVDLQQLFFLLLMLLPLDEILYISPECLECLEFLAIAQEVVPNLLILKMIAEELLVSQTQHQKVNQPNMKKFHLVNRLELYNKPNVEVVPDQAVRVQNTLFLEDSLMQQLLLFFYQLAKFQKHLPTGQR